MFMWRYSPAMAGILLAVTAVAQPLGIGRIPSPDMLSSWDTDISADGTGLPPGHGSVAEGKAVFDTTCPACHALSTAAPVLTGPTLAGGRGTLATANADSRELLALRHDIIRLHPPGDAVQRAAHPVG